MVLRDLLDVVLVEARNAEGVNFDRCVRLVREIAAAELDFASAGAISRGASDSVPVSVAKSSSVVSEPVTDSVETSVEQDDAVSVDDVTDVDEFVDDADMALDSDTDDDSGLEPEFDHDGSPLSPNGVIDSSLTEGFGTEVSTVMSVRSSDDDSDEDLEDALHPNGPVSEDTPFGSADDIGIVESDES